MWGRVGVRGTEVHGKACLGGEGGGNDPRAVTPAPEREDVMALRGGGRREHVIIWHCENVQSIHTVNVVIITTTLTTGDVVITCFMTVYTLSFT